MKRPNWHNPMPIPCCLPRNTSFTASPFRASAPVCTVSRPIATRRTAQASGSTSTQGRAEAGAVNRPQLRVVSGASRAASSSLPFLTVIILVLAGALITSMLLNAKMADTAYRMKEKQIELNVAEDHVETLRTQVQEASAPDALAGRAKELGMVPAAAPGVVDVNKGQLTEGTPAHAAKSGK